MCGRFTISKPKEVLEQRFKANFEFDYKPRFNAAPSQHLPVILNDSPKKISALHWGLEPTWIKSVKTSGGIINVRMENLRDKKTFLSDLMQRRCLILADGFYEWKKEKDGKHPYWIFLKNKEPFSFAGIWEENILANGKKEKTFAIITTTPNKKLRQIHSRMPVILSPQEEKTWLKETEKNILLSFLDAFPAGDIGMHEIDRMINSPSHDEPSLIQAV